MRVKMLRHLSGRKPNEVFECGHKTGQALVDAGVAVEVKECQKKQVEAERSPGTYETKTRKSTKRSPKSRTARTGSGGSSSSSSSGTAGSAGSADAD